MVPFPVTWQGYVVYILGVLGIFLGIYIAEHAKSVPVVLIGVLVPLVSCVISSIVA